MKTACWLICIFILSHMTVLAGVDDAIVMVNGCSGVCVDPSGIVLTAKHCDLPHEVTVRFKQRSVRAVRVYESHDTEGPVAFDCVGDGYPALPVALTPPVVREKLWSLGYPNLNGRRELRQNCGPVLRWATFKYAGGEFNGNVLGFACSAGWSGGPLLNAKGEVCGLLNSSDDRTSVFISSAAVRQAYAAARQSPEKLGQESQPQLPELLVFGTPTCSPCLQFKQDLKSNPEFSTRLRSVYELVWVDVTQKAELAKRYGIEKVPVLLTEHGRRIEGYNGPDDLLIALGLQPKPDPAPPPATPVPEADVAQPSPPAKPGEQSSKNPDLQTPAVLAPGTPLADSIDQLRSLTQKALSVATWLGVTGISGGTVGVVLGGLALWRTFRKPGQSSVPVVAHQTNPPTIPPPTIPPPTIPPPTIPPPTITHDSAPLPQAIVPETRFAAYERDTHAEAFAWATAEMARKYPGAVGTLESLQGLMNQYIAARGLRRPYQP